MEYIGIGITVVVVIAVSIILYTKFNKGEAIPSNAIRKINVPSDKGR